MIQFLTFETHFTVGFTFPPWVTFPTFTAIVFLRFPRFRIHYVAAEEMFRWLDFQITVLCCGIGPMILSNAIDPVWCALSSGRLFRAVYIVPC